MTALWRNLDAMSQLMAAVIIVWFFAIFGATAWWYARWTRRTTPATTAAAIRDAGPSEWQRLLDAVNDPHALDGELTEYEEKAWADIEGRLS